jgi:hypothetical protein
MDTLSPPTRRAEARTPRCTILAGAGRPGAAPAAAPWMAGA